MLYVVIIFLLTSVYLYCLLGGADFGAGIIELFSRKGKEGTRELVSKAMAPIWEANHMWLIITVVILFMGFPAIYTQISISLYIPLILLLVGIVLRGTAFTFRHYDAIRDNSQEIYSRIFQYSSLMVTFFFGLLIGALVSGNIKINPDNFVEGYITTWLNLFSMSTGVFLCSLFAFITAVYLIGDTDDIDAKIKFITKARIANLITVLTGGLVFITSYIIDNGFAGMFFSNPISIALIVLATISIPVLWKYLDKGAIWKSRILAGAQLLFILGAFYAVYFPKVVFINDAEDLTLFNSAAPDVTQTVLGWALIIGSFIIFPALFYLMKVFKIEQLKKKKV